MHLGSPINRLSISHSSVASSFAVMQLACQNSSTSPASSQSVALVLKDESVDFSMGSLIVVRNDLFGVYVFMYSVLFLFHESMLCICSVVSW